MTELTNGRDRSNDLRKSLSMKVLIEVRIQIITFEKYAAETRDFSFRLIKLMERNMDTS